MIQEKLLQQQIVQTVRAVNRASLQHRKNQVLAFEACTDLVEGFVCSTGQSREDLLDRLQNCLENNPEQADLLTIIEMLKQYE